MVWRIVNLGVIAGLVVVVSPTAAGQRLSTLPPPGLRGNAAWLTVTTGATVLSQQSPQVFAITPLRTNLDALVTVRRIGGLKALPRIQQRLLWITVGGWNLDVRVYFGTQHPSKRLLAAVQAELNRLTLPVK